MTRTTPNQAVDRLLLMLVRAVFALSVLSFALPAAAQDEVAPAAEDTAADETRADEEVDAQAFSNAVGDIHKRLEAANAEYSALQAEIQADITPLNQQLIELERELKDVRREYQKVSRLNAARALQKGNLLEQIKSRKDTSVYLSNFMDDYIRKLNAGLHIAEAQRYAEQVEQALLVMEDRTLSPEQRFDPQVALLELSLDRLEDVLGGTKFNGTAVDAGGRVENGTFVMFGPVALFASANGEDVGLIEKGRNNQANIIPFTDPLHTEAARKLVAEGKGELPLDTTLGNARIIETAEGSLMDEIEAGGIVMIPIALLAGFSMLLGLVKLVQLLFVRRPGRQRLAKLLHAVSERDKAKAVEAAKKIPGPSGRMLRAGTEHLGEPRELIEEVMYEQVLTTRLKAQRLLPFIAICAAAAPLLGLLGTVMGIISTFEMMKLFDSSDMKNVSGGISVALITTKFGLIVAIPALLFHAILSRMAKGVVDQMEKAGVAFINQVMKTPPAGGARPVKPHTPADPDPDPVTPEDPSPDDQLAGEQSDEEAEYSEEGADADKEREPEPVLAQAGGEGFGADKP